MAPAPALGQVADLPMELLTDASGRGEDSSADVVALSRVKAGRVATVSQLVGRGAALRGRFNVSSTLRAVRRSQTTPMGPLETVEAR